MAKASAKSNAANFDELFGAQQAQTLAGFYLIERNKIKPGAQPREHFDRKELASLRSNIQQLKERGRGIERSGVLSPLIVRQAGEGYDLIAGERRYRATEPGGKTFKDEWIGVERLPCYVLQGSDGDRLLLQLTENEQRESLTPLEVAHSLDKLMREESLSIRALAALTGKGKGYVENRLALLKLPADLQELVSVRTDTLTHALLINQVENPTERQRLIEAAQAGAGEREIRAQVELLSVRTDSQSTSKVSVRTDSGSAQSTSGRAATEGTGMATGSTSQSSQSTPPRLPDPVALAEPLMHRFAEVVRLMEDGETRTIPPSEIKNLARGFSALLKRFETAQERRVRGSER